MTSKNFIFGILLAPLTLKILFWIVGIEFASPRANVIYWLIWYPTPVLILYTALVTDTIKRKYSKIIATVLLVILLLVEGVLFILVWLFGNYDDTIKTGVDLGFEKIHSVSVGHHEYACYRTNGGAMTDFGIAIRKEYRGFGFVKYSTVMYRYHAYDARFYEEQGHWYVEILLTGNYPSKIVELE